VRHLLLFHNIARKARVWPRPRRRTCHAAVYRREKGELAFLEENLDVATAEFNAIGGN